MEEVFVSSAIEQFEKQIEAERRKQISPSGNKGRLEPIDSFSWGEVTYQYLRPTGYVNRILCFTLEEVTKEVTLSLFADSPYFETWKRPSLRKTGSQEGRDKARRKALEAFQEKEASRVSQASKIALEASQEAKRRKVARKASRRKAKKLQALQEARKVEGQEAKKHTEALKEAKRLQALKEGPKEEVPSLERGPEDILFENPSQVYVALLSESEEAEYRKAEYARREEARKARFREYARRERTANSE